MSATAIRPQAQLGFAAAEAYDAGRPTYPAAAVDQLLQHLEIGGVQRAKVLEIAAGTGKFTEALAARPENYEIVAVEPHDDMRLQLANKKLPGVTVLKGTAEKMEDVEDGAFAAVIAAQSFHWFSNMESLREIARTLQPTGVLGMIWNIDDYNAPRDWDIHAGWETVMREVIFSFDDDQPRFRHQKWKAVFDEQAKSDPLTLHFADPIFGLPIGEASVEYETSLSKEDIWNRLRTLSQLAILEGAELDRVQKTFFDAVEAQKASVDGDGKVLLHGRTVLAWTSRIPAAPIKSA